MARLDGNIDLMSGRSEGHRPVQFVQTAEDQSLPEDSGPTRTKLEERLTKVEASREQSQAELALTRMYADPNIREYLENLNKGIKMKMVTDAPQTPTIEEPEGDPEEMTPSQLAEYIQKKSLAGMQKLLQPFFAQINQQVEQLSAVAANVQQDTVKRDIGTLRKQYSDFETLEPEMKELNNRVRGTLSLEELYKSVKGMRGEPLGRGPNPASERPDGAANRETPRRQGTKQGPPRIGRAGFQDLVNSAFERTGDSGDQE